MNEGIIVEMMGKIDAALLENEYMENDLQNRYPIFMEEYYRREKNSNHQNVLKLIMGITASSLIATGGIILAVKLHKGSFILPIKKLMS